MSERKIGAGHAEAMLRLGLKELRNAANPSRESVADNEIGLYGTQTQGEIAKARSGPGEGPEQESADATAHGQEEKSLDASMHTRDEKSPDDKLSLADIRNNAKSQDRGNDNRSLDRDRGHDREDLER